MEDRKWYCKNGYVGVGDTLEFSSYNSISGKSGERAKIVAYDDTNKLLGDHVILIFDDGTTCCSDKIWNDTKVEI